MSRANRSRSDGRSHRVVAIIGLIHNGQKCFLTLPQGDNIFPGTTFLADCRGDESAVEGLKRGLNRAHADLLKSFGLENAVLGTFEESDNPRADGAHKFYGTGRLRNNTLPPGCTLVPQPVAQVIDRLAEQQRVGRPCTEGFVDKVLSAADQLDVTQPTAPLARAA